MDRRVELSGGRLRLGRRTVQGRDLAFAPVAARLDRLDRGGPLGLRGGGRLAAVRRGIAAKGGLLQKCLHIGWVEVLAAVFFRSIGGQTMVRKWHESGTKMGTEKGGCLGGTLVTAPEHEVVWGMARGLEGGDDGMGPEFDLVLIFQLLGRARDA